MLDDTLYFHHPDGEAYAREFFSSCFFFRRYHIPEFLDKFKNRLGVAVNEDLTCYFASEIPPDDPEYFGDSGVVIYVNYPIVEHDTAVIMNYPQFFALLKEYIDENAASFSAQDMTLIREKYESLLEAFREP